MPRSPTGPEARATAGALALGSLVIAPAGNDGPGGEGFGPIAAPGGTPAALAVGAVGSTVELSTSVRDGAERRFRRPGGLRRSLRGGRRSARRSRMSSRSGTGPEGAGTSIAAARAAGVAALVAAARPDLDAESLRSLLVGSARVLPGDAPTAQGAGLVDAAAAIAGQIALEPAALSFARLAAGSGPAT